MEKTNQILTIRDFFPDVSSLSNIWNTYDDESDEEEPTSKDSILYSENNCFVLSNLWNKREEYINTDYAVTGWMLCVIPHIREDVFKNAQNKDNIQMKMLSKLCLLDQLKKSYMELSIRSGLNLLYSMIIMIPMTEIILSGIVKILLVVTVIYGI